MKTTKPFSTISYNTSEFLKKKLDDLVARRCICFYAFVYHYAEEDEKKNHIHLCIIPNGQIDTDSVSDLLVELDPSNPLKPLSVMPWRSSKWGEWYLYTSHDTAYLASKMQTRKYHYSEADFVSSEPDYLHELVATIDRSKYAKTQEFVEKVKSGVSFGYLLETGQIPAPQFNQWLQMYQYLSGSVVSRNTRFTHTPIVDPHSGEVFEPSTPSDIPSEDVSDPNGDLDTSEWDQISLLDEDSLPW